MENYWVRYGINTIGIKRGAHEFFCTNNSAEVALNAEMRAFHLASRRATSAKICAAPQDYKVCWVCLSIAFKRAGHCPICGAHRFYESPEAVRVVAGLMEKFAFPVTAGTVPRAWSTLREQPKARGFKNGN